MRSYQDIYIKSARVPPEEGDGEGTKATQVASGVKCLVMCTKHSMECECKTAKGVNSYRLRDQLFND